MLGMGAYVLGQRMAKAAAVAATSSSMTAAASDARVVELEERLNRLLTVSEAMWEIVKRHGYSDDDLRDEIERISERDAARSREVGCCASCGSRLSPNLPRCQICGEATGFEPGVIEP